MSNTYHPLMKQGMSSFDIAAMVKELQTLVGGRVDKAFQLERDKLLLRIRVPGKERLELIIVVGKWLYLASQSQETPKTPTSFAMLLRKHLSNGKITTIEQHGFDRIVVFHVEKAEKYLLICEMFGEGNVVLVHEGEIVQPLIPKSWSHREVRAHREYLSPPSRQDARKLDNEDFKEMLRVSNKDIVRALALDINLGGQYAEEVCLLSGIEKDKKAMELTEGEVERTFESMRKLVEALNGSKGGLMVFEGDSPKDIVPFELEAYREKKSQKFEHLSAAIEKYLTIQKEEEPEDVEYEHLKGKYERQLAQQEKAVTNLEKRAGDLKTKAELIYQHYNECEILLKLIKIRIKEQSTAELLDTLKERPIFKELEPDKDKVMVSLMDEDGNVINVKLNYKKSVNENAGMYYDKAKKAREKLEGAKNSILETKDKLAKAEVGSVEKKKRIKKEKKQFWFERYRWFISSDGNIVIAGRDAKTNDKVVKKYLSEKDRYAHAEIHGAPSVVIKNKNGEISEQTLREACEFALAFSKAWNAKIGAGRAYWVLPDQVSKTPPSGEFLPRGAFIIRGKRNFVPNIELRLAVGKLIYEGVEKMMCGPERAIEAQCEDYVVFGSGDMNKNTFIGKLCKVFDVEREEIARILPPGDVNVMGSKGLPEDIK
jgi:predicted ribosome quality control (RQC) complex YloA/Tae2 family protein